MGKKKREEPASEGAPEWMTTYSDLVTLLMCFFVLLFSMAVIDKQKFVEVANSLRSSFQEINSGGDKFDSSSGDVLMSLLEEKKAQKDATDNSENTIKAKEDDDKKENEKVKQNENAEKLEKMKNELQASIKDLQLGSYVKVIEEKTTVTLRIDSAILFESGSADIKESGKEVLKKAGLLLKQIDNQIFVQGHTDNVPIYTHLFPTNWELSTKRAVNVVMFLIDSSGMDPHKLTATGNGEFKPIAPNDNEVNRQKNRRIDIVIVKE